MASHLADSGTDESPPTRSVAGSHVVRGFADELKNGVTVLLHIAVAKVESATIQLTEDRPVKLVIKTDRGHWLSWCNCGHRNYELEPGQLEAVPSRVHSSRLCTSIRRINGGDQRLAESMFQRSLSLLRRYPTADSIDLTFQTPEMEACVRAWANAMLTIETEPMRRSRKYIIRALAGRAPSEMSDDTDGVSEYSTQTPVDEDRAGTLTAPRKTASIYPASRRSDRRGSLALLRTQSQLMAKRRGSGASEPPGDEETGKQFWTWKEPPTLRKRESMRASRGRSTRKSSSAATSGGAAESRRNASEPPAKPGASEGASRRWSRSGSEPRSDFWDPLGLISDMNPRPPASSPTSASLPSLSTHRPMPAQGSRQRTSSIGRHAGPQTPRDDDTE